MKKQVSQKKELPEMHLESRKWISYLQFMSDEILFIDKLLNSYVFEPDTPDLFERLQEYQQGLERTKKDIKEVQGYIIGHENDLGGLLEISDQNLDFAYSKKHEQYATEVESCLQNFQHLKADIFNYAGGILKKRKNKA
jgi:hypothetical protein